MVEPKFSPPQSAVVWESHAAGRFGLGRDAMRELRGRVLTEGEDWIDHGRVLLSPDAVKKCAAALGLPQDGPDVELLLRAAKPWEAPPAPAREQGEAGPGPVEKMPVELLIWHARCLNRRVLLAYREGTDPREAQARLTVRVGDNRRFNVVDREGRPARIRARHLRDNLWEEAL